MLYALGAYEAYKFLYPIARAELHIVQPRLADGQSRWGCTAEELLDFGKYVRQRAELAVTGEGDYHPDEQTCRFCRARGQCRARADENIRLAFLTDRRPPLISNEEVGEYLRKGKDVASWLEDLESHALKRGDA